MIICITTVKQGGMPQFTIQVHKSIIEAGRVANLYIPVSNKISFNEMHEGNIIQYDLPDSFYGKIKTTFVLVRKIHSQKPEQVWLCDETLVSLLLACRLGSNNKCSFFVHDSKPHTYYFGIRRVLRYLFFGILRKRAFKKCMNIVLMSNSSLNIFKSKYPIFSSKLKLLRLGAHVPETDARKPLDLHVQNDYFMFFGTIEKYKNVAGLLRAYKQYHGIRKLVIAGKGALTDEEQRLINKDLNRVNLINRFIEDDEMLYLFENARCIILPYIEASQSGVLAMGYHFSKPVIVSDLPGLTEFVEDRVNGCICKDENDLTAALTYIDDDMYCKRMSVNSKNYSDEYLDFNTNIKRLLE